ncbi:MAG: hypothetical protein GKS03_08040 [Alphaproteobacteria bacterium]|nr:hypothetical protein [Alphaproteobacteria bacterium]
MEEQPSDFDDRDTVLIIRTGGIGAFVQALSAFASIRMHHSGARITLLTDGALSEFAAAAPYFDIVETDAGFAGGLRALVRDQSWGVVYDLDTSSRTDRLYQSSKTWRQKFGLDTPVRWSGTAKGCALPHDNVDRLSMHVSDRMMDQLAYAGLEDNPPVSLAWVSRSVGTFSLPVSLSEPFVLIAVDACKINDAQWTPARCMELAELITARGNRAVLVSENAADPIREAVLDSVPDAIDLCGKASHVEVVFLAWAAVAAVGNDNGLMHLISASGCKSIVLYDPGSDAALAGHRGPDVTILRRHDLAAITAPEVMQRLDAGSAA